MADRYVVLGVAGARRPWLGRVAGWATSAALPLELVTALDAGEARAVLAAGQPLSALLVDAGVALDRDLVALSDHRGVGVVAVTSPGTRSDLDALGCGAVLEESFTPAELHEALRRCGRTIGAPDAVAALPRLTVAGPAGTGERPSPLVAVSGTGGSGASTVAMALAQGFARPGRRVVVVDACRRADLGMYHDQHDPVPGLPELIALCRSDRPDPDQVRALVRPVSSRGYGVLLGWRRPCDWSATRRRSLAAAFDALRRSADVVVVDTDPDLDDEAATGVPDIEDRHAAALTAAAEADLHVVVSRTGVHGLHGLVRQLDLLRTAGADPQRLLPVLGGAPRSPAGRAELTRALAATTTRRAHDPMTTAPPVMVRSLPAVETSHRTVEPLPERLVAPLTAAATAHLQRLGPRTLATPEPVRIRPGSLGLAAQVGPGEVA